jgi:two-component system, chemotaxis family, chemotaxis protein CheY
MGTLRVLVADASDMLRDLFSYGVTRYGKLHGVEVTIVCASDGSAAWDLLQKQPDYDLAIIDHELGTMNGAKLVDRIRHEERLRKLPVVGTSTGGDEARSSMLTAGVDSFLSKPVALRQLALTLEEIAPIH